jgi:hypothetical protein
VTTPYVPYAPLGGGMRALFSSTASVSRLASHLVDGAITTTWEPVTDILDPFLSTPGQFKCRLDLQFVRPGKDQPMPVVAGRAPDRVGVLFFSLSADASGLPLIKSGDYITMVAGPVAGTFEIKVVPDVALDFVGGHHIEVQVVEVSQALTPGSLTPFPGSPV